MSFHNQNQISFSMKFINKMISWLTLTEYFNRFLQIEDLGI